MTSRNRNIASTFRGDLAALSLMLAGLSPIAEAEIIGPDSYGYRADTTTPFTYEDISTTGTRVLADSDDGIQSNVPIGFSFDFYGNPYTELFVSVNGNVTFGPANFIYPEYHNSNLLADNSVFDAAMVSPLWDDWDARDEGDAVYYQTLGTAGVDLRLVIQWRMLERYSSITSDGSGTVDFQLVMFENGDMQFRYLDVDGLSRTFANNGGSATIGIRNAQPDAPANGQVLQVAFDTADSVVNGQAIRIFRNNAPVCDAAVPSQAKVIADKAHSLAPITVGGVTDAEGDALAITIDGVYQDEGVLERGSGKTCPDGGGLGTSTALIRAERVGDRKIPGNGRIYTLGFTATDAQGASCMGAVKVCVPHDTGGRQLCEEDNVAVDSTVCP